MIPLEYDAISWLNSHSKYFSPELNGYHAPPIGPYLSTLPLINRDGTIMDLGLGNGMLLKFLMLFSGHQLVPFGIDFNKEAIEQVKEEVLPEYAENFSVEDVNFYNFPKQFDIIVSNPFYAYPNLRGFTERCLGGLNPGGRLIYRVHEDVLRRHNLKHLDDVVELQNLNMHVSLGRGLELGVFDV